MTTALTAIKDVSVRDWKTGEPITPAKLKVDWHAFKVAVNTILDYLRDNETNFPSGTAPTDKDNGKLWYDTANALLMLRRSGAWEQVLTLATAPGADIVAGGGTATFNLGGPINVDTGGGSISDPPGLAFSLTLYTIPASTLNADDDFMSSMLWGGGAMVGANVSFGDQANPHTAGGDWIAKHFAVRTASGAQKTFSFIMGATDNTGATNLVKVSSAAEDETGAIAYALKRCAVAYFDKNNDELRAYSLDGTTWTAIGSALSITADTPALAAMTATDVAFIDGSNEQLRLYRWNGATWALQGSGLGIPTSAASGLTALNSTDVAFVDSAVEELRLYRWGGSSWSLQGSGLSITGLTQPVVSALSSTDIALADPGLNEIRTYRWGGSSWAQVGNGLTVTISGEPSLTALSSTSIAFIESSDKELRTYTWDGSDWSQTGNSLEITALTTSPAITALNATDIAFIDGGSGIPANRTLKVYRWDGTDWTDISADLSISSVFVPRLAGMPPADWQGRIAGFR